MPDYILLLSSSFNHKVNLWTAVCNHNLIQNFFLKFIPGFLLLCSIVSVNEAYCQGKNEFAITVQVENMTTRSEEIQPGSLKNAHPVWYLSFGGAYERMFSKHSSGVLGVKYRKALNDIYIPVPAGSNFMRYIHSLVAETYLTVPFLYKYNSHIINISAGPSFDFFLSWKQQKQYYYGPPQTYDRFFTSKISIGLLTNISKKFALAKKMILEPTIYYNRILSFNRSYFGGSVEIKYKF